MSEPIPIEQVEPGDRGTGRQRRHKRMKRYLPAKRPRDHETQRIITYRTEACVGTWMATEDGEEDLREALVVEHEWAMERLRVLAPEVHDALIHGRSGPVSSSPQQSLDFGQEAAE